MATRQVTERDFRMPEFVDADPKDYEFRGDGKVVRKDRWERAIVSIRFLVGVNSDEYEIAEVVERVREIVARDDEILQVAADEIWRDIILKDKHEKN